MISYINNDYWLDIGRHEDYARAQDEFLAVKDRIFNEKETV